MALNYAKRLESVNNRRNPDGVTKSFTENLTARNYGNFIGAIEAEPSRLKYLGECMSAIDKKYNDITIDASRNVCQHLEREFNLHFSRAYKTQGSVVTNTNIETHSDIDLLTIVDRYHYLHPALPNNDPYTSSDPNDDIRDLRRQATTIMQGQYDLVNTTGAKSISIYNKNLRRKVDIVFAFWYITKEYAANNDEYYRGVYLFNFQKNVRELDYPFAHISCVNSKGDSTNDGSRRIIRLLKSLKADSEGRIDLTSFQLTTIAHDISDNDAYYRIGDDVRLAKVTLNKISFLLSNPGYRKSVNSPNGTETPLSDDKIIPDLKELQNDLTELISDCESEINHSMSSRTLRY